LKLQTVIFTSSYFSTVEKQIDMKLKTVYFTENCSWNLVGVVFDRMSMGAIWWGTRGTCPPHFFRRGDI